MNRRPKEWDTLGGRFVWMLGHYKRLGISGRQLCDRVGLAPTTISAWADRFRRDPGADLQLSSVLTLERMFDVPLVWIAKNEGWPSEEIRRQFEGHRQTPKQVVHVLRAHK